MMVMGFCTKGHQVITADFVEACIECGAPVKYESAEAEGPTKERGT